VNDLKSEADSAILRMMYDKHALIQRFQSKLELMQHELEQLKQEAERLKLL
jgi:hypothetical protein